MGAKTWMLVISQKDASELLAADLAIDRDASASLARKLFPGEELIALDDGDLYYTNPPDDEIYVGSFAGVDVIAAREFGIDYPSQLPRSFVPDIGIATLHAMHSVVDWFAFAHWVDGDLIRALSLSPDSGIIEDIGPHLDFEKPYWAGQHPAVEDEEDEYPFDFHPLEMGEAALQNFFGYNIEGCVNDNRFDPESVPLLHFRRHPPAQKPWWKFW